MENDNIIQEGEVIFKKNPSADLSVMSKSKGDHTVFLKKKILRKRENGFTMNTQKYHTN